MERIGPYEILEELGQGGMGVVYRARQASLNRMIALKVLPSHLESDDNAVRRFRQEGETAARLKHDNIVSVYDAHVDEAPYYIAMEFLEGRPLDNIIAERGHLEAEKAVAIVAQVCAGLDHAHERGIVHRDIKPANIMIAESGKATVTDFGIARATDQTRLTATGAVFGSPDYMSPEQAKGLPVDSRTDLYSVGALLYEMLTGRTPFGGGSPLTVMNRITTEPPPSPRGFYPSISPALDAVALKALDKDPRARFQSGAEMVRALQAALREPETATYPHAPAAVPPQSETSDLGHAPGAPDRGVGRRRPIPLLAGGLALVLVLIGAVLWAMRAGSTRPAVAGAAAVQPLAADAEGGDARQGLSGGGAIPAIAVPASAQPPPIPQEAEPAPPTRPPIRSQPGNQPPAPPQPQPPAREKVRIPRVAELSKTSAGAKLEAAGLYWRVSPTRDWHDQIPADRVTRTVPSDGFVDRGATVELVLSDGPRPRCRYAGCDATFDSVAARDQHEASVHAPKQDDSDLGDALKKKAAEELLKRVFK